MIPNVMIGGAAAYEIQRVAVLYGEESTYMGDVGRRGYVTLHPVQKDRGGAVRLGPGQPATMDLVRTLSAGLGHAVEPDCLPDTVLFYSVECLAWWTPAAVRTLFFNEGSALASLNGEDLPVPPLVWVLRDGGSLYVRALSRNRRPEGASPAYVAPLWNVNDRGLVCQGSMKRPARVTAWTANDWSDSFFSAAFTHGNTTSLTAFKGGVVPLWLSLKGKKVHPVRHLAGAGTVTSFIRGVW